MRLTRRAAFAGLGAVAVAGPAAASQARRRFIILRDGDDIGRHDIAVRREGDGVAVDIDIEIVVRILGIAAYRYEMTNREFWRDGQLQRIDSVVNDDGDAKRVEVRRSGDGLQIAGPNYTGPCPGDAATTTYHQPAFLDRGVWIDTDSGILRQIAVTPLGQGTVETGVGLVNVQRTRVTHSDDFDVILSYDQNGEWASVGFDAGGEPAVYRPDTLGQSFAAVWRG